MNYITNLKTVSAALGIFILPMLCGCDNAEYKVIDDAVYLAEAYTVPSKNIAVDTENPVNVTATMRTTTALSQATTATIGMDEQALENFNKKNGTNYVMLPDTCYTLDKKEVTIPAGAVSADVVSITIKPFTQQLLDTGDKYALPVTITQCSGNLLESMKTEVYTLSPVIITSVPIFTGGKPAYLKMSKDYHLIQWSVEFCVNISKLGTHIGEMNNQALFSAYPTELYVRFGDAPIQGNILQVKSGGSQVNCPDEFSPNKWYHMAFVYNGANLTIYIDGKVEATLDLPGLTYEWKDKFNVCDARDYLKGDVMMGEVRFWTTAISQNQIQNNMYTINPQMTGLEGYWKMNEGEGTDFHDATGHGNDGAAPNGIVGWKSGVRLDGK